MGSADADVNVGDAEGPIRTVRVAPFAISPCAVTNGEFAQFVAETGYVTEAEDYRWSYVFYAFVAEDLRATSPSPPGTPWWLAVAGAYWDAPAGPGTSSRGLEDHPVVHVSWRDAEAFAAWAGGRLPSEAEWEYAARGGLSGKRFPWGDDLRAPDGAHRCNIFQGTFPTLNTGDDGFRGTAPVTAFEPNGYGLYNVAGNVWEMCADPWTSHEERAPRAGDWRVMRGGSYLCHHSYCNRYRVAARTANTADSSTGNQGFRLAFSR